jgi:hypothetical protein
VLAVIVAQLVTQPFSADPALRYPDAPVSVHSAIALSVGLTFKRQRFGDVASPEVVSPRQHGCLQRYGAPVFSFSSAWTISSRASLAAPIAVSGRFA